MTPFTEIMDKILAEVDNDIREAFMKSDGHGPAYGFMHDPANVALAWQSMRDRKRDVSNQSHDNTLTQFPKPPVG